MPQLQTITEAGLTAAFLAASQGIKIEINSFKIGSEAGFEPDSTETTVRSQVYVGNANQLTYSIRDAHSVLFRITLDNDVGDFQVGNIGLYLTDGTLFALIALPSSSLKQVANPPVTVGNFRTYDIILNIESLAEALEFTINPIVISQLPEVDTEADLPAIAFAPYSLYLVHSNSLYSNNPTFAFRDVDNGVWIYTPIVTTDNRLYTEVIDSPTSPAISSNVTNSVAIGHTAIIEGAGTRILAFGQGRVEGTGSVIIGIDDSGLGYKNTGDRVVAIGYRNRAGIALSDQYNLAAGGHENTTQGVDSAIIGGTLNAISASVQQAAILGGSNNSVTANQAIILGGSRAIAHIPGSLARAVGRFADNGDAQQWETIVRINTTDATQTELLVDGTSQLTLRNNTTWFYEVSIVARRSGTQESAALFVSGAIDRQGTAASTALVNTPVITEVASDNAGVWLATASVDTTTGSLRILVTGEAAKNIRWVARVRVVEVFATT